MAQAPPTVSEPPDTSSTPVSPATTSKPASLDTTSDTIRNSRSHSYQGMTWIEATRHRTATENRVQPWKQTYGNMIDPTKDGEDLIVMRGNDEVQHSGEVGA